LNYRRGLAPPRKKQRTALIKPKKESEGASTFSNHMGAAIGAVVIGYVLVAAAIGTDSLEPAVAKQAGLVASLSILVVIASSIVFASLKAELLGLEDPHWPVAASTEEGAASGTTVL
jgi:hypothetical protein